MDQSAIFDQSAVSSKGKLNKGLANLLEKYTAPQNTTKDRMKAQENRLIKEKKGKKDIMLQEVSHKAIRDASKKGLIPQVSLKRLKKDLLKDF